MNPTPSLVRLPCDCVIECPVSDHLASSRGNRALACPWCDAVFSFEALEEWFDEDREVDVYSKSNPLVKYGDKVLEWIGRWRCGCGCPVVKEKHNDRAFKLDAPPDAVVRLWD